MRRSLALTCVVTAAVAGCASSHPSTPARVEALHVTRSVGCSGWYELSGQTLEAHVTFVGAVRTVDVRATGQDGSVVAPDVAVAVPAGVTSRTVRVPGVADLVAAADATVKGESTTRASCHLANPH